MDRGSFCRWLLGWEDEGGLEGVDPGLAVKVLMG